MLSVSRTGMHRLQQPVLRLPTFDEIYFPPVHFLSESHTPSVLSKASDVPRSNPAMATTSFYLLGGLRYSGVIPPLWLSPLALWVVHQLLIFRSASITFPLPVLVSVLKPTCWEEKWKSWESEIWCPANLSNPVPCFGRGWTYLRYRAITPGHKKGRGGEGHPLFFIHSDKCLSTLTRVP